MDRENSEQLVHDESAGIARLIEIMARLRDRETGCPWDIEQDFRTIAPTDRLEAQKLMHVSPFQTVAGQYRFALDWGSQALRIRILYANQEEGVFASLAGQRNPARSSTLAWAAVRRPMGALRVLALIHWQALILWAKRAPFLNRQPPPPDLLSGTVDPQQAGE